LHFVPFVVLFVVTFVNVFGAVETNHLAANTLHLESSLSAPRTKPSFFFGLFAVGTMRRLRDF